MVQRVQNADYNGYRITNLGDPVGAQDGVTLAYMNAHAGFRVVFNREERT